MSTSSRAALASEYEAAAVELERAAAHLRTTAAHFRSADVPRGCAHAWAAHGHVRRVEARLDALAGQHADHAVP